jgi:Flp pilus assembly pilin Flp
VCHRGRVLGCRPGDGLFLAREVVVERPRGHAGRSCDLRDTDTGKPVLARELERREREVAARFLSLPLSSPGRGSAGDGRLHHAIYSTRNCVLRKICAVRNHSAQRSFAARRPLVEAASPVRVIQRAWQMSTVYLMIKTYTYLATLLQSPRSREEGQTMAEYAVVLAVIIVAIVVALAVLAGGIKQTLSTVNSKL